MRRTQLAQSTSFSSETNVIWTTRGYVSLYTDFFYFIYPPIPYQQQVSTEQGQALAAELGIGFFETRFPTLSIFLRPSLQKLTTAPTYFSAKSNEFVEEAFRELTRDVVTRLDPGELLNHILLHFYL